jgi:threonine efflux protein
MSAWLAPPTDPATNPVHVDAYSFKRGLRMGLLVELANPKSVAFLVSIFAVAIPVDTALWAKATILLEPDRKGVERYQQVVILYLC